jgi:hypothetical protein
VVKPIVRERSDDDGGVQAGGTGCLRGETAIGEGRRGQRGLTLAGLDQQVAAGGQPVGRPVGHAPQHVQTVRAAVQRDLRLVCPGLRREESELPGGHVRHVGGQDPDPASQPGGKRLVQVTLIDVPGNVLPCAAHGGRVDVDGVHLGLVHGRGKRRTDRARAAAQVHHDVPWAGGGIRGVRGDEVPPDKK